MQACITANKLLASCLHAFRPCARSRFGFTTDVADHAISISVSDAAQLSNNLVYFRVLPMPLAVGELEITGDRYKSPLCCTGRHNDPSGTALRFLRKMYLQKTWRIPTFQIIPHCRDGGSADSLLRESEYAHTREGMSGTPGSALQIGTII